MKVAKSVHKVYTGVVVHCLEENKLNNAALGATVLANMVRKQRSEPLMPIAKYLSFPSHT